MKHLGIGIVALLFVLLLGCPDPDEVEGDVAGECDDGEDNDGDGLYDCDDPGCEHDDACPGTDDDDDDDTTDDDDSADDDDDTTDDDDSADDDDDSADDDDDNDTGDDDDDDNDTGDDDDNDTGDDDDDDTGDDDDNDTGDDDDTSPVDADGDGWDANVDCDDNDPAMNLDDNDGDGYSTCDGDCLDGTPAINPGATEVTDGVDNDCDGLIDEVNAQDMVGECYHLDLNTVSFTTPPQMLIDAVIGTWPTDEGILIQAAVIDEGASTVEMLLGYGQDAGGWNWSQDMSYTTTDLAGSWSNPSFTTDPAGTIILPAPGMPSESYDLVITGNYFDNASQIYDGELDGQLDTTGIDDGLNQAHGTTCNMMAALGYTCETCTAGPHAGSSRCAHITADSGIFPHIAGLTLVPVP